MIGDGARPDTDPKGRPLADERRLVLEALDGDALAGPAVLRRMRERSGGDSAAVNRSSLQTDESGLYPALHSLEAGWMIRATWLADDGGVWHRVYRRRRFRQRPFPGAYPG